MNFIVAAPPYRHSSAGIRVLYRLAEILNEHGFPCQTMGWDEPKDVGDSIVIYPEVVYGNPLNAKYIVRYVLQKPEYWIEKGTRTKDDMMTSYPPDEYVVTFREDYYDAPKLRVDIFEPWLLHPDPTIEKDMVSIYVGKGEPMIYAQNPRIEEGEQCYLITHNEPPTREQLAVLLQRTKRLYVYDDNTSLVEEAHLCGARVFWVKPDGITEDTTPAVSRYYETDHVKEFALDAIEFFKGRMAA